MSKTLGTLGKSLGTQAHSLFSFFSSSYSFGSQLNLDTKPGSCRLGYHYLPLALSLLLIRFKHTGAGQHRRSFAMKNSSRAKCRGSYCGGGKPGFWHYCPICGKRFCPKCVRPRYRHACTSSLPSAVSHEDESEPRTSEPIAISRSEL